MACTRKAAISDSYEKGDKKKAKEENPGKVEMKATDWMRIRPKLHADITTILLQIVHV